MKLSSAFLASIYLLAASPVLSYGGAETAPEPAPAPAYIPQVETKPEGSYPEQHHPYTGGKSHKTAKHTGGKSHKTAKHTGGKSGAAYYPGKSRKH